MNTDKSLVLSAAKTYKIPEPTPVLSAEERLAEKILRVYGGGTDGHSVVIDKLISGSIKIPGLPNHVVEFFAGVISTEVNKTRQEGKKKLTAAQIRSRVHRRLLSLLKNGMLEPEMVRKFKSNLIDNGTGSLIGNVSIEPNVTKGLFSVKIAQLPKTKIVVSDDFRKMLCDQYPALLQASLWAEVGLLWDSDLKVIEMVKLEPLQWSMQVEDMKGFAEGRREFNSLEWMDLLLHSVGYNPSHFEAEGLPPPGSTYDTGKKDSETGKPIMAPVIYDTGRRDSLGRAIMASVWTQMWAFEDGERVPMLDDLGNPVYFHKPDIRRKLLALCRLLPLAMASYHLFEPAGRGTGKSYLLRNLYHSVFVVPAGAITEAALIYNVQKNTPGILSNFRVVIFDDMAENSAIPKGLGAALRDFLESGNSGRGGNTTSSDASLYISANIEIAPNGKGPSLPDETYFRVLPVELRDAAIADRLSGLLPGWDLPKLTVSSYSQGVGFLSDYFGEIVASMRKDNIWEQQVESEVVVTTISQSGRSLQTLTRDSRSIKRTTTGLHKLMYPNYTSDPNLEKIILEVATELRQSIRDQCHKTDPGEFPAAKLKAAWRKEE